MHTRIWTLCPCCWPALIFCGQNAHLGPRLHFLAFFPKTLGKSNVFWGPKTGALGVGAKQIYVETIYVLFLSLCDLRQIKIYIYIYLSLCNFH